MFRVLYTSELLFEEDFCADIFLTLFRVCI